MASMWWAGEVVRKTLEGLNDRVRTARGKREAQQALEQRRGKGSCWRLGNGHQRSPELVSPALPFWRSLRFTCFQPVLVDLQEERMVGCPSGLGQCPPA